MGSYCLISLFHCFLSLQGLIKEGFDFLDTFGLGNGSRGFWQHRRFHEGSGELGPEFTDGDAFALEFG